MRSTIPLLPLLLLAAARAAVAAEPMLYIYNAPESSTDVRYDYHWEILKTALDRTTGKFGPYEMRKSLPMTEKRQVAELKRNSGQLTVMYLDATQDFEANLTPVRIPVDKNLGSYNVLLIRKAEKDRFSNIRTVNDLRKFSYGLGLGWIDVDIFRHSNLKVVTGSNYDGLFRMAANGRFDAFPRAAVEVLDEMEQRKDRVQNLCIEENIILYYPLPMYFWFPKTDEGARLADRAREGMLSMIDDGAYDKIFLKYQGWKIEKLKLKDRRVLTISNPFLSPQTPFQDERLWFNPMAETPKRP